MNTGLANKDFKTVFVNAEAVIKIGDELQLKLNAESDTLGFFKVTSIEPITLSNGIKLKKLQITETGDIH
jgi:hypothetical protein